MHGHGDVILESLGWFAGVVFAIGGFTLLVVVLCIIGVVQEISNWLSSGDQNE